MTTICAPGKMILLGEHAVVYGRPALAMPVGQVQACAHVDASPSGEPGWIRIVAPDISIDSWSHELPERHPLRAICHETLSSLGSPMFPALELRLESTIPVASGLGSSAAVSVAIVRSLAEHLGFDLSEEQVSELAFRAEVLHHGTPSGIDNTVVAYGRPVFFRHGQPPEPLIIGGAFHFVIGDTGLAAPTSRAVAGVRARWEADRRSFEAIFDEIGGLALAGREALLAGEPGRLGPSLRQSHELLRRLGVSCGELDRLVDAAGTAGALGAKLSGAGLGGNMIALVPVDRSGAVEQALHRAGAVRVIRTEVAP
jgi:mevalonate kinase